MVNPIIWLIAQVISLVNMALFVWVILSVLISFNIVNRWQPVVSVVYDFLSRLLEPMLRPIRRYMPDLGGIDLSPLVLIILLQFISYSLYYYF